MCVENTLNLLLASSINPRWRITRRTITSHNSKQPIRSTVGEEGGWCNDMHASYKHVIKYTYIIIIRRTKNLAVNMAVTHMCSSRWCGVAPLFTAVKRLQNVYEHCTGLLKRVTEREDCCQVQPWMRVFNFVSVLSEREKNVSKMNINKLQ